MSEEQQAQPQLALERIYTKDISFEVPGAQVFTKEWQPELNINLSSAAEKVDATHFEENKKKEKRRRRKKKKTKKRKQKKQNDLKKKKNEKGKKKEEKRN